MKLFNPESSSVLVGRSAVDVEFYSIIFYCTEAAGTYRDGVVSEGRTREVELSRVQFRQGEEQCLQTGKEPLRI